MMLRKWHFGLVGIVIILVAFVYYQVPSQPKVEKADHSKTDSYQPTKISEELKPFNDPNPHVQHLLTEYENYFRSAIASGQAPGGAVTIIKDTAIIYLKGFGLRSRTHADSVDVNTIFRLGSVSKSMAAILAGRLVDEHIIRWDDAVIKHVPRFQLKTKESTDSLKVRHILSHTIGLPYHAYTSMIEEGTPFDTLLVHLKDLSLVGKPGEVYSYQNVGYSLISNIMESASGRTFESLLQEKVFVPLKMDHASSSYEAIQKEKNVAKPHMFTKKGWQPVAISKHYYNVAPAGGVNASISDMARWLQAINSGQEDFIKRGTLEEIFKPHVKAISRNRNFWIWRRPRASYYGLGWRVISFGNDTLLYHGGYVNGYRSEVAIHKRKKIAISVLTNGSGSLADQSIPKFFKYFDTYADSIDRWEATFKSAQAKK